MNNTIANPISKHRTPRAKSWLAWARDERGSVTVVVALTVTGLMGLLALGIDLGAMFNARSEAQRAADAAALAGASAFLELQQDNARGVAQERAIQFATMNVIRGQQITPEEVTVVVNTDSNTVTARIRRNGLPTWFARIVGIDSVDVGAEATAWAGPAGAAVCVKPFAVPDMWEETTQDLNRNRIWDEGEHWKFEPSNGDRYERFGGPGALGNATGYGGDWRNSYVDANGRRYDADYGRRITVKVTNPHETMVPSFFMPWVLPTDPNQPACGSAPPPGGGGGGGGGGGDNGGGGGDDGPSGPPSGSGRGSDKWKEKRGELGAPPSGGSRGNSGNNGGNNGGNSGGNTGGSSGGSTGASGGPGRGAAKYRQNICSCNASVIELGAEYDVEPGNMVGPTYDGVRAVIAQDPNAYWDDQTNQLVSEYGMDSPRVITVALFDPAEITKPGRQTIKFNNFARIFLEEQADRQDAVTGRLLYYVPGIGSSRSGTTAGSLVRVLQLIK